MRRLRSQNPAATVRARARRAPAGRFRALSLRRRIGGGRTHRRTAHRGLAGEPGNDPGDERRREAETPQASHMSGAVLDASALLAVMLNEPGADVVEVHFERAVISAVNLAEVGAKMIERGAALELLE